MYYISRMKRRNNRNVWGIVDTEDNVEEFYDQYQLIGIIESGIKIVGVSTEKWSNEYPMYLGQGYHASMCQEYGEFDQKVQILYGIDCRLYTDIITYLDLANCTVDKVPISKIGRGIACNGILNWNDKKPTLVLSNEFGVAGDFYNLDFFDVKYDITQVKKSILLNKIYWDCFCVLAYSSGYSEVTESQVIKEICPYLIDDMSRIKFAVYKYISDINVYSGWTRCKLPRQNIF